MLAGETRSLQSTGGFFQKVDRSATRHQTTLVAFVANEDALQGHLPQILLPNWTENRKPTLAEQDLFRVLPDPLEVWPDTSGWVTAAVFMRILSHLRAIINWYRPTATIVLVMDAATQHISSAVLQHAARNKIYLLLIPGSLTYLLQPLDVYIFGQLKNNYRNKVHRSRCAAADGAMPKHSWIPLIGESIVETLVQRTWSHIFKRCGLATAWDRLSKELSAYAPDQASVVPRELTDAEMEKMAGRHRIELAHFFFDGPKRVKAARDRRLALLAVGPPALPAPPDLIPVVLPPPVIPLPVVAWRGRLRPLPARVLAWDAG